MVDAAVDRNESGQHSLRGNGDFAERARLQASGRVCVGQRQGAGLNRWQYPDLGIVGNSGIRRGKIFAGTALPTDSAARAMARAISSEMHAGFVPLRRHMPMNMWRPVKKR